MILTPEQLQDLGMAVFREAGVPEESSASVVEALVRAELDGLPSHGFSRIPFYVDQALSGKVKARAIPLVRQPAPAAVLVDAGNGFAFPAILAGLEKAIPLARGNGVSVLGVTRSHHCGVVGLYAERIAEAGLISLIFSNTPAAMAPWNGSKASFGTNPLAFGCPREGKHPLVIDMSLSKVARGKIMGAKQRGEAIPEGWALDAAGRATTDPVAALGGTMIPVGDARKNSRFFENFFASAGKEPSGGRKKFPEASKNGQKQAARTGKIARCAQSASHEGEDAELFCYGK